MEIPISIAPEKIIEILKRQPGLTHTLKRMLVDLALQQGRMHPGDGLNLDIWAGNAAQRFQRVIDREGRIAVPEAGLLQVLSRSAADGQYNVQGALRGEFRDIQQVDIYDLILNAVRGDLKNLQPGDTVLAPPAGFEVIIEGVVRRPAIDELDGGPNLFQVPGLASGVLPSSTLRHVTMERIVAHQSRTMLSLEMPEVGDADATDASEQFKIQAGNKIRVEPSLVAAAKVAISC